LASQSCQPDAGRRADARADRREEHAQHEVKGRPPWLEP
jgi:hypothetical protein